MIRFASVFFFLSHFAVAQVTIDQAKELTVQKYHLGSSTYFNDFIGHAGYGAMVILTNDGGAAAFGDGDEGLMLVRINKSGTEQWKRKITSKGDEMETQAVAEDKAGNFYLFMLVYDNAKYRGGCERVICFSRAGVQLWDKFLGPFAIVNNPVVSWVRSALDGRISMRGHIVTEPPAEGKDPSYHFWEASINSKGFVAQKSGEVIDWGKDEWKKKFKPE
jgi:outer membrane protein assembly factor BamB